MVYYVYLARVYNSLFLSLCNFTDEVHDAYDICSYFAYLELEKNRRYVSYFAVDS
jgi:hypothetical protein